MDRGTVRKATTCILSVAMATALTVPCMAFADTGNTGALSWNALIAQATPGNNGDNDVDVSDILKTDISAATVTVAQATYTGSALTPAVTVTFDGKALTAGRDYTVAYSNNTAAGTATVTITGIGQYKGTKATQFTIARASISSATVAAIGSQKATGSALTPKPVVKMGNTTLREGTDYTLSYANNVNPGTATVTITGIGNYAGTKTASFTITSASNPNNPNNPGTNPNNPGTTDPSNPNNPNNPGTTDPEPVGTEVMYRLYNPNSGEHFYTSSTIERDAVIAAGWNDEGIGWTAPTEGIKVYRLYNSFAGEHHYTSSEVERDMLVGVGWTWEEGGWYSDPNESVPLYRVYNPNAYANNHHYTLDIGERDILLSLGWQDEGIGWHGVN